MSSICVHHADTKVVFYPRRLLRTRLLVLGTHRGVMHRHHTVISRSTSSSSCDVIWHNVYDPPNTGTPIGAVTKTHVTPNTETDVATDTETCVEPNNVSRFLSSIVLGLLLCVP